MTLQAYLSATRHTMWASQLELYFAMKELDCAVLCMSDDMCVKLGEGIAKFAIRKHGDHYLLTRVHKTFKNQHSKYTKTQKHERAGMMSWDWEADPGQEPPIVRRIDQVPMQDDYTTVSISAGIMTDIRRVTYVRGVMTVADLKAKLATILKIPVASMDIHDEEDGDILPDWTNPTASVELQVQGQTNLVKLDIRVPMRRASFIIQVENTINVLDLKDKLATILGAQRDSLVLSTIRGAPWTSCRDPLDHVVAVNILERAGMERQEISSTLPYTGNDQSAQDDAEEESEEVATARWRDQVEAAHDGAHDMHANNMETPPRPMRERSRSRSRSLSPAASLGRGSASPTRHGHWTRSCAVTLPPAQYEPICKPVLEGRDLPVGYIWADPNALVVDVIQNVRNELSIFVDMKIRPSEARLWKDVRIITFGPRPRVEVARYHDMRIDRWELYQKPRVLPILYNGSVESHAVYPWKLTLPFIQYRLDLWARTRHTYSALAVDSETFVILKRDLPERFMRALEAFDEIIEQRLARAGMRVPYAFAEKPEEKKIYHAEDNGVIAELITHISMEHDIHTNDIVVTTDPWLPKLEDPLKIYRGHMLYVILMDRLYHPEYIQWWPWELHVIEWMAIMQRGRDDRDPPPRPQPRVMDEYRSDEDENYGKGTKLFAIPEGEPVSYAPKDEDDDIQRAGMPRHNQHQDPKVVMHGWAEQKVRDEAPRKLREKRLA